MNVDALVRTSELMVINVTLRNARVLRYGCPDVALADRLRRRVNNIG